MLWRPPSPPLTCRECPPPSHPSVHCTTNNQPGVPFQTLVGPENDSNKTGTGRSTAAESSTNPSFKRATLATASTRLEISRVPQLDSDCAGSAISRQESASARFVHCGWGIQSSLGFLLSTSHAQLVSCITEFKHINHILPNLLTPASVELRKGVLLFKFSNHVVSI